MASVAERIREGLAPELAELTEPTTARRSREPRAFTGGERAAGTRQKEKLMRKLAVALAAAALVTLALVAALLRGPGPSAAKASSHREAPLISEDPSADNTDLYAFRSPDKPDTLTIVSNWIPGEDPAAGPNYYTFSPTARYDIYVDRNGDGKPDVTYYFRFKRNDRAVLPRRHGAAVHGDAGRQRQVDASSRTGYDAARQHRPALDAELPRPRGEGRSTTLAGGGQVFAGQRDDPFFADVGAIFDLLAIRKGTGATGGGKDFLAGYAVHTIALQIPNSQLDTARTSSASGRRDRPPEGDGRRQGQGTAAWVQVSRLGNPLINEVVIPTKLKDHWNAHAARRRTSSSRSTTRPRSSRR